MCPLSECNCGETVYIKGINGGAKLRGKLQAMGLMPGEALKIVSSNSGPVVIEAKGVKLAIGHGMAENIMVSCSSSCPHDKRCCRQLG